MKKLLLFLSILIILVIGGLVGYKKICLISPRVFLNTSSKVIYANENLGSKKYDGFSKFGAKVEKEVIKINELKKYIDGIYAVSYEKEVTILLDAGLKFPIIMLKINDFFSKNGDIYTLKDEYQNYYKEDLSMLGIKNIEKIYMRPYKGNFLLSNKIEAINSILESKMEKDLSIVKLLNENKSGNLGVVLLNMEETTGVYTERAVFTADYTDGLFSYEGVDKWKNETLIKIPEKRVLSEYVTEKSLYVSGVDFENIGILMETIKEKLEIKELMSTVEKIIYSTLKVTLSEVFSSVGNEIVYDMKKQSGIIVLKKTETAEKIVQTVEFLNKLGLRFYTEIEGNLFYIGREKLEKNNSEKEIKENQILYLDYENESKNGKIGIKAESYYEDSIIASKGTIKLDDKFIETLNKQTNK